MNSNKKYSISFSQLHTICIGIFILYAMSRSSWGFLIPNSVWSMAIIVACGLIILCSMRMKSVSSLTDPILIIFILMMLIILFNRNYDISKKGFIIGYFEYIYITFIFISCSTTNFWIRRIIRLIILLGFFYAVFTIICNVYPSLYYNKIYPIFNFNTWYTPHPSAGFTADYSTNGNFISIGLIAALSYYFFKDNQNIKKQIKCCNVIIVGILLLALLLNGKRASLAGVILGIFVCYWNYTADKKRTRGIKFFGLLVLIGILIYISAMFIPQVSMVFERFAAIRSGDAKTNVRILLWKYAIKKINEKPILGFGWRWFKYNNPVMYEYDVHNTILQLLVENGILLTIPFLLFIFISYFKTLYLARDIKRYKAAIDNNDISFVYFALMCQTYMLFIMLFGTSFYLRECTTIYYLSCSIQVYYNIILKKKKQEMHIG